MPDTERHPDITSKYLEAALLDQHIAGAFHGRTYCHVAVVGGKHGWILGVAVANERGYHATGKNFDNAEDAREWARGLNEHIGLTTEEAERIMISSMFDVPYERRRA